MKKALWPRRRSACDPLTARPTTAWRPLIVGALVWAGVYGAAGGVLMALYLAREFVEQLERMGRPLEVSIGLIASLLPFGLVFTIGMGLLAVWMYAAIRPRYGAGPRTALRAALAVWLLSIVAPLSHLAAFGVTSVRFVVIDGVSELVVIVAATLVAARGYREDQPTG